jgi:hypothetical protein
MSDERKTVGVVSDALANRSTLIRLTRDFCLSTRLASEVALLPLVLGHDLELSNRTERT